MIATAVSRLKLPVKLEDLAMAGWVVVASPVLFRLGGDKGPFDAGQPLEGVLRLIAVLGVLLCVAARPAPTTQGAGRVSILSSAAVGPLTGGLLLVAIGGFTALGLPSSGTLVLLLVAAAAMVVVRVAIPPLPLLARRLLVSPFVMIAAGIYWSLIAEVTAGHAFSLTPQLVASDPHAVELIVGFLVAFSAVYFAMLIYAPRQVAEREGGRVEWLVRYLAFVASILLGIGWLGLLST